MKKTILDSIVTKTNLFDSHCHLQLDEFANDYKEVIQNAQDNGITGILVPGIDYETSIAAINLANKYPNYIEAAIGYHPYEANQVTDQKIAELEELVKQNNCITAIGETGLDYYNCKLPKVIQESALTKHAKLAKLHNLYLIIHTRETDDCAEDALKILQEQKIEKAIFHCFSGSLNTAQKIWARGYKTSFSCNITYKKNLDLQKIMQRCPQELLLIETDSPYLSPQNKRNTRNEPANLQELANLLPL